MTTKAGTRYAEGSGPMKHGPDTLERWPGEPKHIHRALLLYAMQHPDPDPNLGRSLRAVGRTMGRHESTVRGWQREHFWHDRIEATVDPERVAIDMYRREYLQQYGSVELPVIADRIIIPIVPPKGEAPPSDTAETLASRAREKSEAFERVERAVVQAANERRTTERQKVEALRNLTEGALSEVGRLLREKKLRLTARDIPSLIQSRQLLSDWLTAHDHRIAEGGGVVHESVRVKHARERGQDVLDALVADLADMTVILATLQTQRDTTVANEARTALHEVVSDLDGDGAPRTVLDAADV